MDHGAQEVYTCCTHPVFSGPAMERLAKAPIKELVVCDTILLPEEKQLPNIKSCSVAELLADAIVRIHEDLSISTSLMPPDLTRVIYQSILYWKSGRRSEGVVERYKLNAVVRTGKGRQARRANQVPAVLYGRNAETVNLAVPEAEVVHFINHGAPNALIDLVVAGNTRTAMIKDLQRNKVKGDVLHIDFYAVNLKQKLTTSVPIHLVGDAGGVKAGGVLSSSPGSRGKVFAHRDSPGFRLGYQRHEHRR